MKKIKLMVQIQVPYGEFCDGCRHIKIYNEANYKRFRCAAFDNVLLVESTTPITTKNSQIGNLRKLEKCEECDTMCRAMVPMGVYKNEMS